MDYAFDHEQVEADFILPIVANFARSVPSTSEIIPVLRATLDEVADMQHPDGRPVETDSSPAEAESP